VKGLGVKDGVPEGEAVAVAVPVLLMVADGEALPDGVAVGLEDAVGL
jgi:hypothetical protein